MSRWLAVAGDTVHVLVLDKGLSSDRIEGIRPASVIPLEVFSRRFYIPGESAPIREAVERADIIHLMGYWSFLSAIVAKAARRVGKPYVFCPAGAWRWAGRSRVLKLGYDRLVGRRIVAGASRLIAITQHERELFESYGVPGGKIEIMPNAVDPTDFRANDDEAFRAKFSLRAKPFILFLGRLAPVKGPDLLLEAFARSAVAETHDLLFAGPDGGMEAGLRARSRELGLEERVRFVGSIHGADKSMALHAAEFLVIPSRHEAMSIVVLEAGVCGTPVLFTDRCGLDDVAACGGGVVVKSDAEAIQTGLDRMCGANLAEMSRRIRYLVLDRYTWESVVSRYKKLYSEILHNYPLRTESVCAF
jgi:glycosyltransferase involved in cell wall biosynthesis